MRPTRFFLLFNCQTPVLVLDENLDKIDKNKETTEYLNVKYVIILAI